MLLSNPRWRLRFPENLRILQSTESGCLPLFLLPYFEAISRNVQHSNKRLEAELTQLLADEGVILLDLSAAWQNGRLQIRVIADRRADGLTIDDCVHLTRQIQHLIDEQRLVESEYRLEVSSPGLDYPLRHEWQYAKNIGRLLKITINGERGPREISGRLTAIDEQGITLSGDKSEWKPAFAEIRSAKVLPEFKTPRTEAKQ